MSAMELKGWFVAATLLSVVAGFVRSAISGHRKYGGDYMAVLHNGWRQVAIILLPLFLYTGISVQSSGWGKIFQSPEVAMGAFLILLVANHTLGCALAVQRNYKVMRDKVSIISAWALGWLCVALLTVVLIFLEGEIPSVVVIWQFVLLFFSVVTYFASAVVVRLVEVGYIPKSINSSPKN